MIVSTEKNKFPLKHKFNSLGSKKIRISNNLSDLTICGDETNLAVDGLKSQLISVKFNQNLSSVAPSCFANCTQLTGIDTNNNIKSIGDYAFYNCTNLTSVNFLGTANKELVHIGDYAFAGSGLKSVIINLQGSVSDSSTNSHCFANCTQLTSVDMTKSTYLADHMFDGCINLKSVNLNNYHSYVNEYAFANCTTLTSITLPQNIYMLADHMFDGCTNLQKIEFQTPSQLRQLGTAVFAGCNRLTSITLPASVSSLEFIDPLFLSGSNINKITFNGISDDIFADEVISELEYTLAPSVLYENSSQIKTILDDVLTSHIPLIAIKSNDNGRCGLCNNYKNKIYNTSKFKDWIKTSNQYYWVLGYYDSNRTAYNAIEKFLDDHCKRNGSYFLQVGFYWKKDDGTEVTAFFNGSAAYSGNYSNIDSYIDTLENKWFKGYEGSSEITYVTKSEITTFGRGENLSVTYVSSSGKEWICGNDGIEYEPEIRIDKDTKSDFKYGIWYYNIRELKAFADTHHLPLLLEFGSAGCDPCKDFKKNTFNNMDFQTEIASKPCLLCRIEIEAGEAFDRPTTTQAYFASHEIGDPKTYIPQLVYYWKKSNNETYKEIWNYNYRSDPGNANYQMVLTKLNTMLGDYTGESIYEAPTIETYQDGAYRYYQLDDINDLCGRYFICDRKISIEEQIYSETTLSVYKYLENGGVATIEIPRIQVGQTVDINPGAYQCFTASESSRYKDLSGVIFVIDSANKVASLYKFYNEIGSIYSDEDASKTGYWIRFYDSSNIESFDQLIDEFEANDTPTIIFERQETIQVIANVIPTIGSTEVTQKNVQINIDSAKNTSDISALVRSAIGTNHTLQSIQNIEELTNIQRFNSSIKYNASFLSWAKRKKYALIDVASNVWNTGAPKKVREFESRIIFDDNNITDPLPKMLVYRACSTCSVDGTVVYCKKKITVDTSKTLNYYTSLIDTLVAD